MLKKRLGAALLSLCLLSGTAVPAWAENTASETDILSSEETSALPEAPEESGTPEPLEEAPPALEAPDNPAGLYALEAVEPGRVMLAAPRASGTPYPVEGGNLYFDAQTGTITGCDKSVTSAEIPAEIDGVAVTKIGDFAFSSCPELTGPLTIPDSVTEIGHLAFSHCSRLTGQLVIPRNVTYIGEHSFYGCSGFTGELVIPSSLTKIGYQAFRGCSSLTGLTIENGVTSVGFGAFMSCSGLTSVSIPKSVTSIGGSAFSYCSGLTGNLTIPGSVTEIGNEAFDHCSGLTGLTIENGVASIGDRAFFCCSGLTSVSIPQSVTSIEYSAFYYCSGLKAVFYAGSESDWQKIDISDDNDALLHAKIYYNCGRPLYAYPVTVDTPGNVPLPENTKVFSLHLSGGRLNAVASGEYESSTELVITPVPLTPGNKLFFLEPDTYIPLARPSVLP